MPVSNDATAIVHRVKELSPDPPHDLNIINGPWAYGPKFIDLHGDLGQEHGILHVNVRTFLEPLAMSYDDFQTAVKDLAESGAIERRPMPYIVKDEREAWIDWIRLPIEPVWQELRAKAGEVMTVGDAARLLKVTDETVRNYAGEKTRPPAGVKVERMGQRGYVRLTMPR